MANNDATLSLTWTPLAQRLDIVAPPTPEAVRAGAVPSARVAPVEELTGMTSGGVTPVGLPAGWPVLIDPVVAALEEVLIGGGGCSSKILAPGRELAELPGAEVVPIAL